MARGSGADSKARALDKGLKGMFHALRQRAVPERLKALVDRLEAPPKPNDQD